MRKSYEKLFRNKRKSISFKNPQISFASFFYKRWNIANMVGSGFVPMEWSASTDIVCLQAISSRRKVQPRSKLKKKMRLWRKKSTTRLLLWALVAQKSLLRDFWSGRKKRKKKKKTSSNSKLKKTRRKDRTSMLELVEELFSDSTHRFSLMMTMLTMTSTMVKEKFLMMTMMMSVRRITKHKSKKKPKTNQEMNKRKTKITDF